MLKRRRLAYVIKRDESVAVVGVVEVVVVTWKSGSAPSWLPLVDDRCKTQTSRNDGWSEAVGTAFPRWPGGNGSHCVCVL